MTDAFDRVDRERAHQRNATLSESEFSRQATAADGRAIDVWQGHRVLAGPASAGHLSGGQRAQSMLRMQQTHGNRAVQRQAHSSRATSRLRPSSAPVPVQRQDEDEPLVPRVTPFPYPTLDLPLGPGTGIAANPSEIDLNWKLGGASGKLGYEYEGNLTGEANLGDYWLKGGLGKKGFSLGLGHGNPLITPPGIPPMANDPSGDLRGGDLDPRTIGKSLDDMKDYQPKPGWSWGLQGGKDEDKGYYGWGGIQYNW